ncbi:hypothetical protein KBZ15_10600 [Cyanobium sp. BA20m-p-22]|jgi:hypothetical protein|uniref:hypothetical protein n=1 Tax=Cyanobium sp. BA20m-p-22 TaxID=2823704 RepID=UPI0020CD2B90|nr:hypothetical protein [Cyanobium sp. BA20m-p-22]MCP9910350.1 hypothetical protein [Cyanobium sp. BA20m-p-22]
MKQGVGDWVLIKLIDYEDSAWEHLYRHPDGREAIVGPGGYCSDPDLDWLLHQQKRRLKQRLQVNAVLSTVLNTPLLIVAFQAIGGFGWRGLLTLAGYGLCCISAFGGWNAVLLDSFQNERKGRLQMLSICVLLYFIACLLLSSGPVTQLSLSSVHIPLPALGLVVGLLGSAKQKWEDESEYQP